MKTLFSSMFGPRRNVTLEAMKKKKIFYKRTTSADLLAMTITSIAK